jgi:hypothetical protein
VAGFWGSTPGPAPVPMTSASLTPAPLSPRPMVPGACPVGGVGVGVPRGGTGVPPGGTGTCWAPGPPGTGVAPGTMLPPPGRLMRPSPLLGIARAAGVAPVAIAEIRCARALPVAESAVGRPEIVQVPSGPRTIPASARRGMMASIAASALPTPA